MFHSISVTKIFIVLILHVISFAYTIGASNSSVNESDYVALMDMKSKILGDPFGVTKSWNGSVHFCTWPGITCGRRHRRVTILNLSNTVLVGSLSPFLGNLSFLRELILWNNTFRGNIPPEFGRLVRLQRLNLSKNSLEGEIPANLSRCSNLLYISIAFNTLTGKIPEELGSLPKLKFLAFRNNNLTGPIPPSLSNVSSLLVLSAPYNSIVGDIPESLGQLKNLETLEFGNNNLSGLIPPSIYNISSLTVLSLSSNQLHGSLPKTLGLMLPHLQILQLGDNHFAGSLPASLSNASELKQLDVIMNRFSGKISIDFGGMKNLFLLAMGANKLGSGEPDEMTFLNSITNCKNLKILELGENQLRGVLHKDIIGNLSSQLSYLSFAENRIYGGIPSTIGKLVNLNILNFYGNQLRGTIPSSIGNLQKLQSLSLSGNILSGEIPESLGNLTLLNYLSIHGNVLEGGIPPTLGNCKNLLSMSLSQNKLTNMIPKQIFEISSLAISLDLSQNQLVGSLPVEIGEMVNLASLDLSENNLSGKIPQSISKCISLEKLSLAGNLLYGSIPSSFSSLRGLQIFNVSHNNLSGPIPLFLNNLALQTLDLSFNDLEGEVLVQGVFANASILSVVGNNRLCGGIAELQLIKCHNTKSKKHKTSYRIIIPIVIGAILIVGLIWLLYFFICSSKRRSDQLSSASVSGISHLQVSYGQLFKATNSFSSENLIGVGSFGSVYKGNLNGDDGFTIAVKVINLRNRGASKSFMRECEALRHIRHRNLLKIVSCCSSIDFQGNDFKALVYEFMSNGSLESWLHGSEETEEPSSPRKLDILQRLNISVDVACALEYLHHHCETQIVHCDIKPSNILLDRDMTAHVGDFGLAKFLPVHTIVNESNSIGIKGSIGYVAPEYGFGAEVSSHGDVYSYGILLLEIMTGKRPTDPMFVEGLNLHKFVGMAMPNSVIDILDPNLLNVDGDATHRFSFLEGIMGSNVEEYFISIFHVGLACSVDSPQDRMDMSDVVLKLQSIRSNILRSERTPLK